MTRLVVDVADDAAGARVCSFVEVDRGRVLQLTVPGRGRRELTAYDVEELPARLARLVPPAPATAPADGSEGLPSWLELPSELLVASARAVALDRDDLLGALLADHVGALRGDPPVTDPATVLRVLHGRVRGRLRVLLRRPRRSGRPDSVAAWLLHDDGWRELRPGPEATTRLVRRRPEDLVRLVADLVPAGVRS